MKLKKILKKAGLLAGKSVLREFGVIPSQVQVKFSQEAKEDLANAVYTGVLAALAEIQAMPDPEAE